MRWELDLLSMMQFPRWCLYIAKLDGKFETGAGSYGKVRTGASELNWSWNRELGLSLETLEKESTCDPYIIPDKDSAAENIPSTTTNNQNIIHCQPTFMFVNHQWYSESRNFGKGTHMRFIHNSWQWFCCGKHSLHHYKQPKHNTLSTNIYVFKPPMMFRI